MSTFDMSMQLCVYKRPKRSRLIVCDATPDWVQMTVQQIDHGRGSAGLSAVPGSHARLTTIELVTTQIMLRPW